MGFAHIKKILALFGLLIPTACASSGIIPNDMNLSLTNVVVTQSDGVEAGNRFSHELREEVRYAFSKAEPGEKEARIFLEVRELSFKDLSKKLSNQGSNKLVSYGRLVDAVTGEAMGEFPLTVESAYEFNGLEGPMGQENIRNELTGLMARATLDKVYGKIRAAKISENPARHVREPYLIKVASPLPLSFPTRVTPDFPGVVTGISDDVIADVAEEQKNNPKVIKAPLLPVQ